MSVLGRALLAATVAVAVAIGCSTSVRDPDSETNWLVACTTSSDCKGAAECVCGLCTIPCRADDACAPAPRGAACTSLAGVPGCTANETGGRCIVWAKASTPPSNPTGTCTATGSGARVGALPGEGDVWLPDCQVGLTREYWRVFVRPTGTAYILPDPLAPPQSYVPACADLQHPLFDIVTRYSFCNSPRTHRPSDAMTPADAMTVAHYFHVGGYANASGLFFGAYGPGILPDPFLSDVAEACKLTTADDSPGLPALCDRAAALLTGEEAGADAGENAHLIFDGQPGADVAYLLNRLYGIDGGRYTLPIDPSLCGLPADPGVCKSASTRYFYSPITAQCEPRAYGSCGSGITDFATPEECRGACLTRASRCLRCDAASICVPASDCSRCPVVAPGDGAACPDSGLTCRYGAACSYTTCQCQPDGAGGMLWSCASTAC